MKNTIISVLADFFCPSRCLNCGEVGSLFCSCCRKNMDFGLDRCLVCGGLLTDFRCEKCALPFGRQYCLGGRKGVLKELINVYKYRSARSTVNALSDLVLDVFDFDKDVIFVPLPTIRRHIRERGFGHIELLASKLGRSQKILKRANSTVQVGANSELRVKQASEAYEVANAFDPERHYVLVDDVWTTGSSMMAAAQKMRSLGAHNLDILVLAKTV